MELNIPLKEVARIMGKDYQFVCIGIFEETVN